MTKPIKDQLNRPLRDLRISVTDRCNFRCTYCMPKDVFGRDYHFLPRRELLTFEEIQRLARLFAGLGVRKFRLTGGEPLMRRDVEHLIAMLADIPGIDLTLTTNGSAPLAKAALLKRAGLKRITVSLDSLDESTFAALADVNLSPQQVLDWIGACAEAGLQPLKINMTVRRGINESSVLPMAEHFRGTGHTLRFIEFMDVGTSNGWDMQHVLPGRDIVAMIEAKYPLEPIDPAYVGEVARRYRYRDGAGEIGIISSVTQSFCHECRRIRLSADGQLFTCLFADSGHDLRSLLRNGVSDDAMTDAIVGIWRQRSDRYSEIRSAETRGRKKVEMSYIGG